MAKSKEVIIRIKVNSGFVSTLRLNMSMRGSIPPNETHELDVLDVLGLVVLGESMGALPEDTWSKVPPKWRPDIDIVPEIRKVIEK